MKRVRIEHDGRAVEGTLDGDTVTADGTDIKINQIKRWLPPVTPGKILATHLTYRSRAEEYKMARMPSEPSYFMKPPSSLSGHLAPVVRPAGCRFLNYEGEVAVVIGRRCHRVEVDEALD
jgi:5-oxopent-3-ene-1,2,5-tricarboxylate decarboxylase/2-hydroxyhepta-2,4-diene-1,7-dioate isomerase